MPWKMTWPMLMMEESAELFLLEPSVFQWDLRRSLALILILWSFYSLTAHWWVESWLREGAQHWHFYQWYFLGCQEKKQKISAYWVRILVAEYRYFYSWARLSTKVITAALKQTYQLNVGLIFWTIIDFFILGMGMRSLQRDALTWNFTAWLNH